MMLVMQFIDSVTGQTLARVGDTKQGPSTGRVQWSTSVSDSTDVQRVFGQWADALRKAPDEVNDRAAAM